MGSSCGWDRVVPRSGADGLRCAIDGGLILVQPHRIG